MKKVGIILMSILVVLMISACGQNAGNSSGNNSNNKQPSNANTNSNSNAPSSNQAQGNKGSEKSTITIAWQPNESTGDLEDTRLAIGEIIEKATGKKVEHYMTTDYIISIEALVNGSVDMAYMGANSYVEARDKSDKIAPIIVNSGSSGTLDDAVYYGWLAVNPGDETQFAENDGYSIANLPGKRFSFVSNSSTSGFKVPTNAILTYFANDAKFKDLTPEDLMEGGKDQFFSEVLYGGSHQGSAVNLLTGKVDVAAFCDTCVGNYIELVDGEANRPGATYRVKDQAEQPFDQLPGKEFRLIQVTPVLNGPFVANLDQIAEHDIQAIIAAMTSDETTNNERVFLPEDAETSGLFWRSGDAKFLPVEDAWYDPIRELSN